MGSWVLVGGSVLGVCSLILIIYSLWANSPRRQLRKQMRMNMTGSYATLSDGPPLSDPAPAPAPAPQPRAAAASRAAAPPPEKTVFMAAPVGPAPKVHTVYGPAPGPLEAHTAIALSPDQRTQFLSIDDMFSGADARIEPTQIIAADEVYGEQYDDADEDPTTELPMSFDQASEQTMIVREGWEEEEEEAVAPQPVVSSTPRLPIPSRSLPGASVPQSKSVVQRKPVASASASASASAVKLAPPDPSEFVKPAAARAPTPYVGYRGADADDDDDDDDDEVRPETEIVHQGELLRLMVKPKGQKP